MTVALISALHLSRSAYDRIIIGDDSAPSARIALPARLLGTLARLPGNLVLLAGIAWRGHRADPYATRWRAYRLLQQAAPTIVRALPGRRWRLIRGWLTGDAAADAQATALVDKACHRRRFPTAARIIALAIAAGRPALATDLLTRLPPDTPQFPWLTASLQLAAGEWEQAAQAEGRPAADVRRRAAELIAGPAATLAAAALAAGPARRTAGGAPARVLHLVTNSLPWTQAGYTVRTHHIVRAQRAVGLDPHVLTRWGFPVAQGHLTASGIDWVDGIAYHRLRGRPAAAEAAALALVDRLQVSVLHAATDHPNAALGLRLRARTGIPLVYEVRGFLEESRASRVGGGGRLTSDQRLSREAETAAMLAADAVLTLGEAMRAEIIARGVPAARIHLVPNGIDPVLLAEQPEPVIRQRLGLSPTDFVVGTVTTIYPHEGLRTLVSAARLLRQSQPAGGRLRVLIVGGGPGAAALRALCAEDLAAGDVLMTGPVPGSEVAGYFRALDIFALPRTNDRVCHLVTPLKPLEAMALGIPVIGSNVGGIAEVVDDGRTGLLVPPEDAPALAEAITRLRYDDDTRSRLRDAARSWVAEHRTWPAVAATDLAVYREVRGW